MTADNPASKLPRIAPLPPEGNPDWPQQVLESTGSGQTAVLMRTLANHPGLLRKFFPFGAKLLNGGTLDGQRRELAILRTAFRAGCGYEWWHHVRIGLGEGLTERDVAGVVTGPSDLHWSADQALILTVVDELFDACRVSDGTWAALTEHLNDREMIELVMVVGCYRMLAGLINSVGIALDEIEFTAVESAAGQTEPQEQP